jgi:hypothetical protein
MDANGNHSERPVEGFVRRLLFHMCAGALRNDAPGPLCRDASGAKPLSREKMIGLVRYAARHGFLCPQDRVWWDTHSGKFQEAD